MANSHCLLRCSLAGVTMLVALGCSDADRAIEQESLVDRCSRMLKECTDERVAKIAERSDLTIAKAFRLRSGDLLCCTTSSKGASAIILSPQGNVLYVEPRVRFGEGGFLAPMVVDLKGDESSEQVVVSVPRTPLLEVVELTIVECSDGKAKPFPVTKYTCAYVEGPKGYGVFPGVLTFGWNQHYLVIVRKSASALEPFEVLELVTWDEKRAEYAVHRFSDKAFVQPPGAEDGGEQ